MSPSDESKGNSTSTLPSATWLMAIFAAILGVLGFPVGDRTKSDKEAFAKRELQEERIDTSKAVTSPVGTVLSRAFGNEMGQHHLQILGDSIKRNARVFGQLPKVIDGKERRLNWLIAMIPDPIHSHYRMSCDEVIDAMVRGLQDRSFTMLHYSLPWKRQDGKKPLAEFEDQPGAILFQQESSESEYLVVLTVGESPTGGAHRAQLEQALALCHQWSQEVDVKERQHTVSILGPTFSGSVPGLANAIRNWSSRKIDGYATPDEPHFRVRIVTGSATSPKFGQFFKEDGARSETTCESKVKDDICLLGGIAEYLIKDRGLKTEEIALLAEESSGYGQNLRAPNDSRKLPKKAAVGVGRDHKEPPECTKSLGQIDKCLKLVYPLSISRIRVEIERDDEQQSVPSYELSTGRQRNLAIREEVSRDADDLLPTFSQASLAVGDLVVESLIETIRDRGIRAVGLLGTDIHDKLFLARKLREAFPDLWLFTTESHLLYTHSDNSRMLRGMLIGCSFHLNPNVSLKPGSTFITDVKAADDTDAELSPAMMCGRVSVRQFSSDTAEGTYAATIRLVDRLYSEGDGEAEPVVDPEGWLCVVGNDRLWPLQPLPCCCKRDRDESKPMNNADQEVKDKCMTEPLLCLVPWSSNRFLWLPAVGCLVLLIGFPIIALIQPPRWGGRSLFRPRSVWWGMALLQWCGLLAVIAGSGAVLLLCPQIHDAWLVQWFVTGGNQAIVWCSVIVISVIIMLYRGRSSGSQWFNVAATIGVIAAPAMWYLSHNHGVKSLWAFRSSNLLNQVNSVLPIGLLGTAMYVFGTGWKRSQILLRIFEWTSATPRVRSKAHRSVEYAMWVGSLTPRNVVRDSGIHRSESTPKWSANPNLRPGERADLQHLESMLKRNDLKTNLLLGLVPKSKEVIDKLLPELGNGSGLILVVLLVQGGLCWWNWRRTIDGPWFDSCFAVLFTLLGSLLWFGIRNLAFITKHVLRDLRAVSRVPGLMECVKFIPGRLRNQTVNPILCRRPDPEDEVIVSAMLDKVENLEVPDSLSGVSEWLPELIHGRLAEDGDKISEQERQQKSAVVAALLTIRIREASWHIRNLAATILIVLLLVYLAIASYPFQTWGTLQTAWGVLFVWAVYIMFKTILEFNRNETLSLLSDTNPNELTFDRTLFLPMLQYVVIPIIAVFTVANPSLGRMLLSWSTVFGSIFRFTGGG